METKGIDNIFSGMTPVSDYESDTEVIADLARFQVTKAELFSHTREPAITIWENRIKFNMVFLTGDIHGVPWDLCRRCKQYGIGAGDIVVLLGDVGANYRGGEADKSMKAILDMAGPTFLCIHGNHEMRPWNVSGYELKEWNGGKVWVQDDFPNLLFAKDGEIFELEGNRCIVIGGAYSVDKGFRLRHNYGWWPDEQPSAEIKAYVEDQLRTHEIDVVLSHTCPFKYEPREMFLPGVDQRKIDDSTERWLDTIEETIAYKAWYCGHWHTDKRIGRMHFLFNSFEALDDYNEEN